MSDSREKDEVQRLVRADNHIQKVVAEYGLDCFPQEFDVIPAQKMLEIMSYNLPVNYSHWSFGRDYEKQRTQYEYSGGIPYEVVLNSNPSRAFLMRTNPYPIQVLVMAHVYGHNDFMKNNIYFGRTRRDMLTSASEAAGRLRKYEEDYGVDEVERLLDAAQAIQMHIEADLFQESAVPVEPSDQPRKKVPKVGMPFADLFDFDGQQTQKSFEEKREDARKAKKKIPAEPDPDLMGFIMRHSPRGFEEWELDVLNVVREQSIYFMPQRKTKVMNEGWASFWHMRIMSRLFQDGFLTPEEHGFYNLYNARVLASNPFGLNPYLLGIKTFLNIEKRYDAGQFGPEWERSESPDKWNIDLKTGKGMEKVFEVRRTHMDWFFLDEFMNRQVVEDSELYIYGSKQQGNVEEFSVEETNWHVIKDLVVRSFAHSGVPLIKVTDGDYGGKREMYMKHFYDGLTLEEEYARQTLRHVYSLWDRPVHLETVEVEGNSETRIQLTYDGKGFSKINLGSFTQE
jgi:stage V sporulation protein R